MKRIALGLLVVLALMVSSVGIIQAQAPEKSVKGEKVLSDNTVLAEGQAVPAGKTVADIKIKVDIASPTPTAVAWTGNYSTVKKVADKVGSVLPAAGDPGAAAAADVFMQTWAAKPWAYRVQYGEWGDATPEKAAQTAILGGTAANTAMANAGLVLP